MSAGSLLPVLPVFFLAFAALWRRGLPASLLAYAGSVRLVVVRIVFGVGFEATPCWPAVVIAARNVFVRGAGVHVAFAPAADRGGAIAVLAPFGCVAPQRIARRWLFDAVSSFPALSGLRFVLLRFRTAWR